MAKEQSQVEFRYYELPPGEIVLAKLGKGWEREYGLGDGRRLHFHNLLEIGFCYEGAGELILAGDSFRYHGGSLTVIPENIPHTTISDPGRICKWEFLFVDLAGFFRERAIAVFPNQDELVRIIGSGGLFLDRETEPQVAWLVRSMLEECRKKQRFYQESVKGYLYALFMEILRLHPEISSEGKRRKLTGQVRYVDEAVRYIYANYKEDIHLSDIAQACGLSESHFRRVFEESLRMKPVDFLNTVRIREACRLIEREDLPIRDVCTRVGYITPSTFHRNFMKITGMSPGDWKRERLHVSGFFQDKKIVIRKGWEGLGTGTEI